MKRQISLHNRVVNYSVRRSKRAKRMRLAVYPDGKFVVTLPKRLNDVTAKKYIIQKSKWVLSKLDFFSSISLSNSKKLTKRDYLRNKEKALEVASERVNYFNKLYKYSFNTVAIKNQKTRWGSCSKKRNLNFNYKILFLTPELRDYVIIHELCHLKELNHSNKFWKLVSTTIPNYKNLTDDMKMNGLHLM